MPDTSLGCVAVSVVWSSIVATIPIHISLNECICLLTARTCLCSFLCAQKHRPQNQPCHPSTQPFVTSSLAESAGYSDEIVKGEPSLQRQQQDGVEAQATAEVAAMAAPAAPQTLLAAGPTSAKGIPALLTTCTAGTAITGGSITAAAAISHGGAGTSSLLPLLMDSLPFMVTVIAQSSTRVLYQNGPSKAYHGAYHPGTSGAGEDLLLDLFSMSPDRDQLLKV